MPGNGGVYAAKRRKKPVQKKVKPPPVKTNPSKRHRDRLNGELDRLTGMLPFSEEVRGRLDKLSVLRLSVGYLKVKSYFHASLQKHATSAPLMSANGRNRPSVSLDGVGCSEGELLLQALNGFVLVVATEGTIFYTSPTVQDFLGFHQSDVVQQSMHDLVHVDDREMFKCQLHFALNPSDTLSHTRAEDVQPSSRSVLSQYVPPENSSFLERSFCCRLRCLLDNTSGFMALNFTGRLKYLPGNKAADGTAAPPQLALFAIATPLQPPAVMEIRTKTLIFQTKHRMDFAPVGIDTRGKLVLGYTEIELVTTGSGYQFIHAADMMYCADNHLRMMKTGDSGFTFFRLLTKTGHWLWVQATARIVFKGAKPDFIVARQKALTNEEGEEHLHQRRRQLPFNLATGEGVLYDVSLESIPGPAGSTEPAKEKPLDPASLLGSLRRQDQSVYTQPQKTSPQLFTHREDADWEQPQASLERAFLDSHALLSVPGQERSLTGDLTADAMIDSLEEILGDIGGAGIEGLDVDDSELRDWENTLARMKEDREDAPRELNHILANDVFSYVEEALRRETGVCVQGSDQTVPHFSSSLQQPGFVSDAWQQVTDRNSGFAGDGCFSCANGLKGAPQGLSHSHACRQMISTHAELAQHSWLVQNTNSSSGRLSGSDLTNQSVQHGGLQQTCMAQSPSVWQQSFHPSHTAGSVNATFLPQTQRLSGSCMYEKREGHILNTAAAARPNGPLLGPPHSRGTAHGPFAPPHPGADVRQRHRLTAAPSAPENGSLQSSFFCWNSEAQIPRVPLNGTVDPFAFPALPAGSVNLSQNYGS